MPVDLDADTSRPPEPRDAEPTAPVAAFLAMPPLAALGVAIWHVAFGPGVLPGLVFVVALVATALAVGLVAVPAYLVLSRLPSRQSVRDLRVVMAAGVGLGVLGMGAAAWMTRPSAMTFAPLAYGAVLGAACALVFWRLYAGRWTPRP